jgi:hypothetical protein
VRAAKTVLYATPLVEAYALQKQELPAIERELLVELRCSLEVLSAVPVSLLTVEMRRDEHRVKHVIGEVADSNNRMKDLAAAWKELG